jgi:hypothetical protein
MLGIILRRATQSFLVALAALALPTAADAGTINIIIGDQNVVYLNTEASNTGSIFDTPGGRTGGSEAPGTASRVTTATFKLDGAVEGTLLDSDPEDPPELFGDLKVDGVGNPIPKGIVLSNVGSNGGGFGFDFFTVDGYLLELGIDKLTNLLIDDGVFFFRGTATVNLATQDLPFNLGFTSPTVFFTYSASSVLVPPGETGSSINMSIASGSFTITGVGVKVPEPAATIMIVSGLSVAGLACYRRRRRST